MRKSGPCAPSESKVAGSSALSDVCKSRSFVISGFFFAGGSKKLSSHLVGHVEKSHVLRNARPPRDQCLLFLSGVELVSRATNISRRNRNLETCWRQVKALKKSST